MKYPNKFFQVITELAPLLSEADLHIAQLTLTLLTSIAQLHSAALARVSDAILPEILTLVKSPLLQGMFLD
jgi:cullin-associated NEDD8-dissociated protein 1